MSAGVLQPRRALRAAALTLAALWLVGCAGEKPKPSPSTRAGETAKKPWRPLGPYTPGGLYAPGVADGAPAVPPDVEKLPEPVPHPEPLARYGNRSPYTVLGKSYTVLPSAAGYDEVGIASWYGTKFDGRVTSSLEPYDLAQFSAAHRTLPLPSYARVTNLENGRSVIVRINDRGPFHDGRLIDLSYAAAIKLGVNVHGTARVEVRGIDTGMPLPADATNTARTSPPRTVAPSANAVASKSAAMKAATPAIAATPAPKPAYPDAIAAFADKPLPPPPANAVTPPVATTSSTMPAVTAPTPAQAAASGIATSSVRVDAARGPLVTTPPSAATASTSSTAALTTSTPPVAANSPSPAASPSPMAIPANAAAMPPTAAAASIDPATIGFLQVGSFGDQANAQRMVQRLQQAGIERVQLIPVQIGTQSMWRVHIGPLRADEAPAITARMRAQGLSAPPFFRQ